ncbi:hypothetical protein [Streptomyces cinereoruber]
MWRAKPSKETVEAARRDFREAQEDRELNDHKEPDRLLGAPEVPANGGHL